MRNVGYFQICMVCVHSMINKTVFFLIISRQVMIWQLRSVYPFVVQKVIHILDWSGHVSVIVVMHQKKVSNGPGRTSVMIDVPVIQIKSAVVPRLWVFGILHLRSWWDIVRLNSEDFLKFFLCSDILFQTFPYERADWEVRKNAKFFSNSREYSWFFRLFRGFSYKNFFVQWATVTCYVALDSP